jgi:hypothetical protein
MNDGDYSFDGSCNRNLRVCGALRPGGKEMRKQLTIRFYVKVDLAACLQALVVFFYLLT